MQNDHTYENKLISPRLTQSGEKISALNREYYLVSPDSLNGSKMIIRGREIHPRECSYEPWTGLSRAIDRLRRVQASPIPPVKVQIPIAHWFCQRSLQMSPTLTKHGHKLTYCAIQRLNGGKSDKMTIPMHQFELTECFCPNCNILGPEYW